MDQIKIVSQVSLQYVNKANNKVNDSNNLKNNLEMVKILNKQFQPIIDKLYIFNTMKTVNRQEKGLL